MTKKKPNNETVPIVDGPQLFQRNYSKDKTQCCVKFWLPQEAAVNATSVAVAGCFNGWSIDQNPLKRLKNGDFALELELPAGKEYEFRFVIDGTRWESAWNADKYVWSDDGNCDNSVVIT